MVFDTIGDASGSMIFDGFAKGGPRFRPGLAAFEASQTKTPVRRQSHYDSLND